MARLPVIRMGHPTLRQRARELSREEALSSQTRRLVADLMDTMKAEAGIGIAAPQVGVSVRLALIDLGDISSRYPDYADAVQAGLGVYINPKVTALTDEHQAYWEGCLSVPGLRGLVSRPRKVRVEYWNEHAEACAIEVEGFLATVFQHEFDHLDGVLYVDRVADTRDLAYLEEYQQFVVGNRGDGELE